ncbi:MAG: ribosome-associated translation inhibitor RaiA [Pseudobdellovibrionaceae bacterium]|nr:ribosome-associated translation inhibitor RaiA [Bdellovibrionales bacterium]USN48222.1 MAG: ribosome-associated translation inhibitor RaiA [Pseudobdellovibrionaceae bacterium]
MFPLTVTFPDFDPSDAVRAAIEEKAEKLQNHFENITSCKVTVASPHHHHQKGHSFHIQIVLHVPGQELVVSKEPEKNEAHTDVYVAIRDAFKAAERQLDDYARKLKEKH